MKKNWINPELTNLSVSQTRTEGIEPFFFWPDAPACSSPVNPGKKCDKPCVPCQYFTPICAGWKEWSKCKYVKPVDPSGS